ncbi:MAG: B12-binding domain-containing radical SAM protein, partial [Candidatus Gastranaerophilales bacterium]|nr:B12-binding domain-containing radical SAM protein [Candidatus Gastranaerophilales bacterium]
SLVGSYLCIRERLYRAIDLLEDIEVDIERIYSDTKTTRIMRDKIDLIASSFTFDMDFLHILKFLEWNKYEFKAKNRKESDPLIFAGGPVITSNPEPYKEIFDFFVIGDGEDLNTEIVKICHKMQGSPKYEILKVLSKLEGVYVPSFEQKAVTKITKKLSECIYTPIISNKAFFPDTFIMEVERGCANRCCFCLASYMNLPIRFVKYEKIIDAIELGLKHTNKIALLGAQITAHPRFRDICKYIENKIDNGKEIEMSVSSLRVDSFIPEIVNTLTKAGQKNLTLAIEAGSERLRKVINKNLTEEQIFTAVKTAKDCGLKGLKFYGMIGLPTETEDDIKEIINLSKRLKANFKGFDISFGFSTFVPKANTPFQWFGRENEKKLEAKTNYLKKELHKLGIQISVSSAKWDYYQALLSRGDSNLTDYLIEVYKQGGKLGAFKKAAKNLNINTDYYAIENYPYDKKLPWDFIDIRPGKDFLIKESSNLTGVHNPNKQD